MTTIELEKRAAVAEPAPEATPYGAYGLILGGFAGVVAATAALEQTLRRPVPTSALDLALLGAATFKVARVVSRERLGKVVREPFVATADAAGDGAPHERPVGSGLRRAVGELVTCSRCTGTWAAAGLVATRTAAPRFGRVLVWTLAAGAVNDFLHAGFAAICARTDDDRR